MRQERAIACTGALAVASVSGTERGWGSQGSPLIHAKQAGGQLDLTDGLTSYLNKML